MPHFLDQNPHFLHGTPTTMTKRCEYVHRQRSQHHGERQDAPKMPHVPHIDARPEEELWSIITSVEEGDCVDDHRTSGSSSEHSMRKSDSSWIDVHAPDAWNDEEETFFDCPVFLVGDCNCGYRSYVSKIDDLSRSHFISESLHVSRQNHLLERTGDWLIDSCKFREWLDPKGSPLLWLHGKAGKGKSMLTSAILDSLKTSIRYGDVLTFFFYDGRFKGFNLARNILGEMLVGLLSQLQPGESRESLDSLSADLCTVGDKLSVSQMKFFFSAIRHSLKSHQTLWIVLDGLDEVEDSRRGPNEVLGALLRLATTYDPEHRIKCFISSRPAYLSGRMLWDCIQVDLDLEVSARNDLKRYVNETVQMLPLSKRSVQPPDFVEELVTRANGVFLWVALVVRSLLAEADNWNNTQRHSEMSDLSGIYRHMFNLIPKENCSTALIMLGHVVAAARPLSITELGGFMELDSDLTASDIARLSGGLLTMQKGQRVSLVHFSAREFIPLFPGANESIARTCVKALHPHDLAQTFGLSVEETAVRGADQASKIRSYVCHYWKFHYLLAEPQSNSLPGLLHSYLKGGVKNKLINSSVTNTAPESHFLALNQPEFRHTANMVLRAACHNGFPKLAKLGLQLGATEHVSTSYTESLLHLAVKVGDIGVIASLINYGADVNQRDQAGLTPLYFAAISANREIVELLCRHESVSFDSTLSMGSQTSEHSPDRADGILDKGGQPHHLLTILKLSVTMLNRCSHCLGIRPEYTLSPPMDKTSANENGSHHSWLPIHILGDAVPFNTLVSKAIPGANRTRSCRGTSTNNNSQPSTTVLIGWFPGVDMYEALRVAAKRGVEDIKNLLLGAGNDPHVLDKIFGA